MKTWVKSLLRSKTFWFCLAFLVVNTFVIFELFLRHGFSGGKKISALVVFSLELLLLGAYFLARKKSWPLEKLFLVVAIPLGLLFLTLMPLGQSPDEYTHAMRIYGITDGYLLVPQTEDNTGGSPIPTDFDNLFHIFIGSGTYSELLSHLSDSDTSELSDHNYVTAALYNPICYLPQTLGVGLGRLLSLPFAFQFYLGRLFNFVLWLVLIYFALKFMPKYKSLMLFAALLPITLQEATSLAPDALTIGLVFFLIAFVLHLAYAKTTALNTRDYIILYALALLLGFCKIVYLPLLLLYFLIPAERFGDKRRKHRHAIIIFILVAAVNLAWLFFCSRYLVDVREGVSPSDQLSFILHRPFRYLIILAQTCWARFDFYMTSLLGTSLAHFEIALPQVYFYLIFAFFILVLFQNTDHFKFRPFDRIILVASVVLVFVLIHTSLYLQWTPVAAATVEGVQGRYFLPFLPLVPILFNSNHPQPLRPSWLSHELILLFGIFVNVCALSCIFFANV